MNLRTLLSTLACFAVSSLVAPAITVDFTITGTYSEIFNNTPSHNGVVKGEFFGLTPNGTGENPTGIEITQAPAVFNLTAPIVFTGTGSFDVDANGNVTQDWIFAESSDNSYVLSITDPGSSGHLSYYSPDSEEELGTISYITVPEPNEISLLLFGTGALLAARAYRRRTLG